MEVVLTVPTGDRAAAIPVEKVDQTVPAPGHRLAGTDPVGPSPQFLPHAGSLIPGPASWGPTLSDVVASRRRSGRSTAPNDSGRTAGCLDARHFPASERLDHPGVHAHATL